MIPEMGPTATQHEASISNTLELPVSIFCMYMIFLHMMCHVCSTGCPSFLGTGENGLPRCKMRTPDYMEGEWRAMEERCRPKTLEDINTWAYPYQSDCNQQIHMCQPDTDKCRRKVMKINEYAWFPKSCSLESWDALKLSKAVGARRVVMVGDSLTVQQFFSLRQLMDPAVAQREHATNFYFHTVDNGFFQVVGVQFLAGRGFFRSGEQQLHVLPNATWYEAAQVADILIISTGHHWHRKDPTYGKYNQMALNVLQALQKSFRGELVLFRTSPWGHASCDSITEPLADAGAASLEGDPFHWMLPIHAESIWSSLALQVGLGGKFLVNNASMTLLRGDAHVDTQYRLSGNPFADCLHNCMPGTPDYWNWILYNTVMGWPLINKPLAASS